MARKKSISIENDIEEAYTKALLDRNPKVIHLYDIDDVYKVYIIKASYLKGAISYNSAIKLLR